MEGGSGPHRESNSNQRKNVYFSFNFGDRLFYSYEIQLFIETFKDKRFFSRSKNSPPSKAGTYGGESKVPEGGPRYISITIYYYLLLCNYLIKHSNMKELVLKTHRQARHASITPKTTSCCDSSSSKQHYYVQT